ncbi:Serine/threonine-protein kinase PRR1 [Candida viswanathii]|uniref:Serine/threonine-protein kinase PRR1 n=1 Tax=Candida viswanathii TaxID=5486 RepID=A0A367YGS9_9ASCO|nr:Serine/threonine-protein kinase PRR1 [Candida viswanathii]
MSSHPDLKIQIPNHPSTPSTPPSHHHHHHAHAHSQSDNIDDFKTSVLRRNSMRKLGEPILIPTPTNPNNPSATLLDHSNSSTNTTNTNINLEKLTQLPTPIIKSKPSFTNNNNNNNIIIHNRNYYTHEQLNNHDQTLLHSTSNSQILSSLQRPRISSEYRPITRAQSLKTPKKRIVSDSVTLPSSSSESSSAVVSSPTDDKQVIVNLQDIIIDGKPLKTVEGVIGNGNFSTVFLGKTVDDELVAIKVISTPDEFITREIDVLKRLNHPSIIKMLDYSLHHNDEQGHIIFNYCQGGSLLHFLVDQDFEFLQNQLNLWRYLRCIIAEMIILVGYLHLNNIIHRDLKLENILLTHAPEAILDHLLNNDNKFPFPLINLSDFGLSRVLSDANELLSTRCGSTDYVAPEVIMGLNYNGFLSDSWSLGVCIYSILENRLPFDPPPANSSCSTSGSSPKGSPTVMKRRRSKNNTGYRIAMIDWEWYKLDENLKDDSVDDEIKTIWLQLKSIVESVLVRKEKRISVVDMLQNEEFKWIKDCVPDFIFNA